MCVLLLIPRYLTSKKEGGTGGKGGVMGSCHLRQSGNSISSTPSDICVDWRVVSLCEFNKDTSSRSSHQRSKRLNIILKIVFYPERMSKKEVGRR